MKVGDYVRFYDRSWTEIGQIVGEVEDSHLKVVKCRDGYYDLDNFIKSSPNIIDLIEVGDYVNGCLVSEIKDKWLILNYADIETYEQLERKNENIKSIVTKEQFERMQYNLGSEVN